MQVRNAKSSPVAPQLVSGRVDLGRHVNVGEPPTCPIASSSYTTELPWHGMLRAAKPSAPSGWMDRLTAGIPIGGTILDLGCGTGDPVARAFLQQGFRITGVDSSPNLVAIAKGRLPEAEWIVADMRRLNLKRRSCLEQLLSSDAIRPA